MSTHAASVGIHEEEEEESKTKMRRYPSDDYGDLFNSLKTKKSPSASSSPPQRHHHTDHWRSSIESADRNHHQPVKQTAEHGIVLLKDSMAQFHWPRADFEQLLSVSLKSLESAATSAAFDWSGGFRIDAVNSFYLNLRSKRAGESFYLKVEILLDGGTFYVIFTDIVDFPLPVRLENLSQVPIYFYQAHTAEEKYLTNVKPGQVVHYAWDEPVLERKLVIGVRGGTCDQFDANQTDDLKHLYYENFIYIAFTDTFAAMSNDQEAAGGGRLMSFDDDSSSSQQHIELVLAVYKNRVILERKESGNRAQLWHMTADGLLLVHEGSSPPRELAFDSTVDLSDRYVLDIDDVAPQPNRLLKFGLAASGPAAQ